MSNIIDVLFGGRNLAWMRDGEAACAEECPDLFFPPPGYPGARAVARAKKICETCPLIEPCRDYALKHDELYGVWGGLSEYERRDIRRRRRGVA